MTYSAICKLRTGIIALLVVLANGIHSGQVFAAETLTLSSWLPPTHPIVTGAIKPWAKQVREATNGNVRVRVLTKPLGSPLVHFDLAKDGVADITYGLHSYTKGNRFLASNAAQFPFMGRKAEPLSVAYWNAHQKHLEKADEHSGTKVLSVFTHGPGMLHNSKKAVSNKSDLQGLKIRVPGGYGNDVVEKLGATQMLIATPELYESLSRGIVDGVAITAEALVSFDLTKTVKHTTTFPGGLYNTTWFLVMNQDKWGKLSAENQKAIMDVSGEQFARLAGKAWDEADNKAWPKLDKAGIEVKKADDQFVAELKAVADELEAGWADKVAERGVDGRAVLAEIRADAEKP